RIVDDRDVYRLGDDRYFVVPNAANTEKVHAILRDEAGGASVEVSLHEDWCFLAVQGPRSVEVVSEVLPEAAGLGFMHCTEARFEGTSLVLTRSGYTGEVGFELFPPEASVHDL